MNLERPAMPGPTTKPHGKNLFASRMAKTPKSFIREILKVTEQPGILSMAGGLPSADTFPVQAIRDACDRVLTQAPREALQYAASEGFAPLREWVAQHLGTLGM